MCIRDRADGVEFLEGVGLADPGIVVGDGIIAGDAVHGLAGDGVAEVGVLIDVNPDNAGEEALVDELGIAIGCLLYTSRCV